MICPKCRSENFANAQFCLCCGATLPLPSCQTPQPAYQAPMQQYPTLRQWPNASAPWRPAVRSGDDTKNWASYVSLMCGIISIPCCLSAYGGIVLGIGAIVLGIIGVKSQKVGCAVAGLITGSIAIAFSVMMLMVIIEEGGLLNYYNSL